MDQRLCEGFVLEYADEEGGLKWDDVSVRQVSILWFMCCVSLTHSAFVPAAYTRPGITMNVFSFIQLAHIALWDQSMFGISCNPGYLGEDIN